MARPATLLVGNFHLVCTFFNFAFFAGMTRTDRETDGKDAVLVAPPKCFHAAENGTTATNWRYLRTVDQLSAAAHRNHHHTMYIVARYYWTGTLRPVSVWYSVSGLTAADSILRVIPFRSVDSLHPAGIDRLLMGLNGRDAAVCGRLRKLSSRREAVGEQALHSTTTTISWRRRRITATNAPPTTPRGKKTHRFIF